MRGLILILLVAVVAAHTNSLLAQWTRFKSDYNRQYASSSEEAMRFRNFAANLERAKEMHAKMPEARFGVTQFSDLSLEEFRSQYLMKNMPPLDQAKLDAHYHGNSTYKTLKASSTWNWEDKGATTPIYNQGQCGSCWAFSATETVESFWKMAGNPLTKLSMEQVVDCDTQCYGCQGGWTYAAYEYMEQAGGLDSYQSYPYTAGSGQSGQCQFNKQNVAAHISGWKYVTQSDDENEMRSFSEQNGPLSVCVYAEAWMSYQGGVFMASQCQGQIDHCVQFVGWNMGASTP